MSEFPGRHGRTVIQWAEGSHAGLKPALPSLPKTTSRESSRRSAINHLRQSKKQCSASDDFGMAPSEAVH